MSLDVWLTATKTMEIETFSANITHNLNRMATEAGIYEALWRPDEAGFKHARELIGPLTQGLAKLKSDPEHFMTFNSHNGWGKYEHFVPWVESYLAACVADPEATIGVSR